MASDPQDSAADFSEVLGVSGSTSVQQLTLYIPNKDQRGREVGDQRRWVLEAAELLARIGGGFTILPPVEGGWVNRDGEVIWEHPVLIYTFIRPGPFLACLPELRRYLHRLGRETGQGEVAFEFDGEFYGITEFDQA